MKAFEEVINCEREVDITMVAGKWHEVRDDVSMCKLSKIETCKGYFLTFVGKVGWMIPRVLQFL